MKHKIWSYLFVGIVTFSSNSVFADSPVWKVEKGGQQLFIGGTIHVLSPSDYPLPSVFDAAYQQAEMVVFETDLQQLQTPAFQAKMLSVSSLPHGKSLKDVLSQATYQDLERFLQSRAIPIEMIIHYKAGMATVMITMIELQRLGLGGAGVDAFFHAKALQDQKSLGQLETADEQLDFLATMGEGMEDDMIASALQDMHGLQAEMASLKSAWMRGDNRRLQKTLVEPLKNNFPNVYQNLMVKRNRAWMSKIEAMLQTDEVELVLVGALHLVGDDSILAELVAKGYRVEML